MAQRLRGLFGLPGSGGSKACGVYGAAVSGSRGPDL